MKKFTLIELIIVIAIVMILLGLIIPAISNYRSTNTKIEINNPHIQYDMSPIHNSKLDKCAK